MKINQENGPVKESTDDRAMPEAAKRALEEAKQRRAQIDKVAASMPKPAST